MTYFVDGFDPSSLKDFLSWTRDDYDSHDQWGWSMSWLFDIAGELERRGETVPPELHYRPGAMGPDVSEDRAEGLAEIDAEVLQRAALVLHRFETACRAKGLNY